MTIEIPKEKDNIICKCCGKVVKNPEDIAIRGKDIICFDCYVDTYCPWIN